MHDIGKFAQRARQPDSEIIKAEFYEEHEKAPEQLNALYTRYFVQNK
jgi:hypothetical protein